VSNTPWRRHKVTAYEGGISTPLLARWPAGIPTASEGTYVREPGHIIDLLPTFMELAGAKYPGDGSVKPEGQSILPMLQGGHGVADRTFCWEHEGNRAIRKGKWKLVTLGNGSEAWELYDLATDRTESHNLAATQPEVVQELAAAYDAWAKRCGVVPWDEIKARRAAAREKK
jgi:arylsulfatase